MLPWSCELSTAATALLLLLWRPLDCVEHRALETQKKHQEKHTSVTSSHVESSVYHFRGFLVASGWCCLMLDVEQRTQTITDGRYNQEHVECTTTLAVGSTRTANVGHCPK